MEASAAASGPPVREQSGRRLHGAILLATGVMAVYQGWVLFAGEPNNQAVALGFFASGALAAAAVAGRARLLTLLREMRPRRRFVVVGGLGAVLVETFFWAAEQATGATGVAASPNLAIDLLVTMPWYLLMLTLLWKVLTRYRYTLPQLLLLGGVYELGADGLLASFFGGQLGPGLIVLLPVFFPIFIVVYGAIILPAALALRDELATWPRPGEPPSRGRKALYGLLPLLGLLPYALIVGPLLLLGG
ncbi:MAG: hypothetical protein ACE5LS_02115 [Thermoplasmata archaeon]